VKFAAATDSLRQENISPIFLRFCFGCFHSAKPLLSAEILPDDPKVSLNFVVQLKIDQKFSFRIFNLFDGGYPHFH